MLVKVLIGLAVLVLVLYAICWLVSVSSWGIFRKDKRNPFRRHCNQCHQVQEFFTSDPDRPGGWWEDMGPVDDPECECHNHQEGGHDEVAVNQLLRKYS